MEVLESRLRELSGWRRRLLTVTFRSSAAMHLLGTVAYLVTAVPVDWLYVAVAMSTCFAHSLLGLGESSASPRSVVFLASMLAEIVFFGVHLAWSPTVVLLCLFATLFAGLAHGRRGALFVVLTLATLLLLGGVVSANTWTSDVPSLDPEVPSHWIRAGVLFTVLTGSVALLLHRILGLLRSARREAERHLDETKRETREASGARATRKAAEAAVWDARRVGVLSELSSGLAHRLNDTLTLVRSAAERLSDAPPGEVRRIVAGVRESVERASRTTRDLLVFAGRSRDETTTFELATVLTELRPTLLEALPENVELVIDAAPTEGVSVERQRFRQLLLELILNARDAMSSGGRLRLGSRSMVLSDGAGLGTVSPLPAGTYAVLEVSDEGQGMTAEVVERACDPFFTSKDPTVHAGLGLFSVFGILQSWGGSLAFDTNSPRGTTVRVFIPARAEGVPETAATMGPKSIGRDWRDASLDRSLAVVGVALAVALVGSLLLSHSPPPWFDEVLAGAACLSIGARLLRNLPRWVRVAALLASMYTVTTYGIWATGFWAPAAVAAHSLAVLSAAVYGGPRLSWCVLLLAGGVFWGRFFDPPIDAPGLDNADPRIRGNWFRVATILPLTCWVGGRLVLDVIDTATETLARLENALIGLSRAREDRATEARSLERVQEVAGRAGDLELAGRAVGAVAHDLNNALTGICGWASLLEDDPAPSRGDVREAVETFDSSADFAEALVAQLDVAESASEERTSEIGAVVRRCLSPLRRLVREPVGIETDLASDCWVAVPENGLRRVLFNLAANARDAMPSGGVLTLRCRKDSAKRTVVLEVADTGIGMDANTRERAFEPFFTTKGVGAGTGLGLHTVASVVAASGGRLDLESSPGRGSKFTLQWPEAKARRSFGDLGGTPGASASTA